MEWLREALPYVLPGAALTVAIFSAGHALLNKRDPRSQLGWLIVCLFVPVIGALGYWLIGNNRIRTRARRWHQAGRFELGPDNAAVFDQASIKLSERHPARAETLSALLKTSARVTRRPLLAGNRVTALYDGEQAFPAMLQAIGEAESYVYLCTYLFDTPGIGTEFIDALGAAAERGARVMVLLDAIGERYSWPRASKVLKKRYPKVEVQRFLPLSSGLRMNLRNHRKVLVVDGRVGFTGGMNIGHRHMVKAEGNKMPTRDLHFQIEGPAILALEQVFLEDWWFTTGKHSEPPGSCSMDEVGPAVCRGIKDGPNEDLGALEWILVGAISSARESVRIMTPYFIPSREILSALTAAVLRGVRVDIILPEVNNLPFVAWASTAMLPDVLRFGVRVYMQPPPFSHTKLLVVDDFYVNVGSANLDPRSLRLNFEFNLEIYDESIGGEMASHFENVRARSHQVSESRLAGLPLPVRLRNSFCKIFAPYL